MTSIIIFSISHTQVHNTFIIFSRITKARRALGGSYGAVVWVVAASAGWSPEMPKPILID